MQCGRVQGSPFSHSVRDHCRSLAAAAGPALHEAGSLLPKSTRRGGIQGARALSRRRVATIESALMSCCAGTSRQCRESIGRSGS